jgi:hypothetical protein
MMQVAIVSHQAGPQRGGESNLLLVGYSVTK